MEQEEQIEVMGQLEGIFRRYGNEGIVFVLSQVVMNLILEKGVDGAKEYLSMVVDKLDDGHKTGLVRSIKDS